VHVVAPVVVSPAQASVTIDDQAQFTATVTGLSNSNVTWRIVETGNAGTIDANGLYTAPKVAGTFHIVASSVSDPTFVGTATVTVTAGSGTVIIQ
jgi:chitinase